MKLTIIGSNSAGNSYLLGNDQETLILECGVRFDRIQQALGFNLKKVVGCLISHEHKDHCKSVHNILRAGINAYTSAGTHKAMGTSDHHRAWNLESGKQAMIGNFKVLPFDVMHGAAQPFGYLIYHDECGSVLFLTDSYYSRYKFSGLNNIILEANYCENILQEQYEAGVAKKYRDHVIEGHMSIQTCKELLKANDLSQVNNIVLIHLSDGNSDALRFQREVQEVTGKTVHIAEAGMEIPFNKTPF